MTLGRKLKNLCERNKFYILTNGKQTEKNYFDLIKSKRSIYDVKVKYLNATPSQLVNYAKNYTDFANQVWCVFDIDNTYEEGALIPALNKAEELGVNIAFSNQSFEVWLLSHFKRCDYSMNISRLNNELNSIIKNELGLTNHKYDKADKELLGKYFIPKYKNAIVNSKIVHQKYIKECSNKSTHQQYKIWEWNSCTNVYELIEALQLEK